MTTKDTAKYRLNKLEQSMIPSRWVMSDIDEETWRDLDAWSQHRLFDNYDKVVNTLALLPAVQREQLRGYKLLDVMRVAGGEDCIRVYMYKNTDVGRDVVGVELYIKWELITEDGWQN